MRGFVLLIALGAVFIPVATIEMTVLSHTGGIWSYPLDDTFIHMAIARNLAFFGTWGITPYAFSSASSSLLYTLLLAGAFKIFHTHLLIPFVINCLAGIALVVALQAYLQKEQVRPWGQICILLAAILLTPLPIMIVSGMEHTLQILFTFLFLTRFSEWLGRDGKGTQAGKPASLPLAIYIFAILTAMIRYEGLFLIAVACCLLAYRRRWAAALGLGLVSLLPLLVFGWISVSKGSYFLPNSVLLKSVGSGSAPPGFSNLINNILVDKLTFSKAAGITSLATQRLLILIPLVFIFFQRALAQKLRHQYALILLTGTTLLHLSLASTGWFYRYEAYLVCCTVMITGTILWQDGKTIWQNRLRTTGALPGPFLTGTVVGIGLFALSFPLLLRSTAAFSKAVQACVNIHEQQYQMGQFVQEYYSHIPVAVNDVGAVSYYSRADNVDLWGLGNIAVARSKRNHRATPAFLDSLSRAGNVRIAIVYDSWFDQALLQRWTKVASWQIPNNVICGDDKVSFYAVDTAATDGLKTQLRAWQPKLPGEVTVTYH